jgi:hypothetical protein
MRRLSVAVPGGTSDDSRMHLTPVPVPLPALMKPGLQVQVTVPVIGHDEQAELRPHPPLLTEQGTKMQEKAERRGTWWDH